MELDAIYRKTQKGLAEMASRTYRLPARERSVLILVDGKSPAREIIDKAKHFGNAEAFFAALIDGGFIEPGAAPAAASTPAASVPAQAIAPLPGRPDAERSLVAAKGYATSFLIKAVGPQADMMTGEIEACADRGQFLKVLEKYREVVRVAGGGRKAEEFWNGAIDRLP